MSRTSSIDVIYTVGEDENVENEIPKKKFDFGRIKVWYNRIAKTKYGRMCTLGTSAVVGVVVYVGIHYGGNPHFHSICSSTPT